ncbi:MAG TPA: hypothetical protein VL574_00555 [Stellaceae bacterium]|nr:hypothetical protein [Stellaceae bacterium]
MIRQILMSTVLAAVFATGAVLASSSANAASHWRLDLPQQSQQAQQQTPSQQ